MNVSPDLSHVFYLWNGVPGSLEVLEAPEAIREAHFAWALRPAAIGPDIHRPPLMLVGDLLIFQDANLVERRDFQPLPREEVHLIGHPIGSASVAHALTLEKGDELARRRSRGPV